MTSTMIYVEGGGDSKASLSKCRRGFSKFFEKIVPQGRKPKITACGGRQKAYQKFTLGYEKYDANVILLVDSEGPVSEPVWDHLKKQDSWDSSGFSNESAHLMVQSMETWFLADKEALAEFYGQRFALNSLPPRENIEEIPKKDVGRGLDNASRNTSKGRYHKTQHAFDILASIDPKKLDNIRVSKHASRLFSYLRQLTS